MKIPTIIVCSLLSFVTVAAAQPAGRGRGQPGAGQVQPGGPVQGGQGRGQIGGGTVFVDPTTEMGTVLTDLTDTEKSQLKDKVTAAQSAVVQFRTQTQTKLQELQATGDQQAVQDFRTANAKDILELNLKNNKDIESVLTEAQKEKWEAYLLAKLIKQKLQPAVLTKEETDKIDSLVFVYGKDLVAVDDAASKNKVDGTIYKKVLDDVITDDQFGLLVNAAGGINVRGGPGANVGGPANGFGGGQGAANPGGANPGVRGAGNAPGARGRGRGAAPVAPAGN